MLIGLDAIISSTAIKAHCFASFLLTILNIIINKFSAFSFGVILFILICQHCICFSFYKYNSKLHKLFICSVI